MRYAVWRYATSGACAGDDWPWGITEFLGVQLTTGGICPLPYAPAWVSAV
jgi:hypothetical protein